MVMVMVMSFQPGSKPIAFVAGQAAGRTAAPRSYQPLLRLTIHTTDSITGT